MVTYVSQGNIPHWWSFKSYFSSGIGQIGWTTSLNECLYCNTHMHVLCGKTSVSFAGRVSITIHNPSLPFNPHYHQDNRSLTDI